MNHKTLLWPIIYDPSFGAMISFAFAEYVKKVYNLEPVHVFLSGASAPYVSVTCLLWFLYTLRKVEHGVKV